MSGVPEGTGFLGASRVPAGAAPGLPAPAAQGDAETHDQGEISGPRRG